MLTHRHHRYLTRWPRRLAFALAIALLLAAVWRGWHVLHPAPVAPTTLAIISAPGRIAQRLVAY